MSKKSSKLIPLARLVRPHGFPKNRVAVFKADLYSVGGEAFRPGPAVVWIAASLKGEFREIPLAGKPAPHGGKWGQAKAVLLPFDESQNIGIGSIVALPRDSFPALKSGEFYVADVLGFRVEDDQGKSYGVVTGFLETPGAGTASINLKVGGPLGEFQFPSTWIERVEESAEGGARIVVPQVSDWVNLEIGDRDE